jgi:hypothetical protein
MIGAVIMAGRRLIQQSTTLSASALADLLFKKTF